ncbi:hypothetical protein LTR29_003806 [Friedmanniomyces endolithicus]|nr:hypothetical protein LTR29_003806 [Friedmanniomyces endolithicus]
MADAEMIIDISGLVGENLELMHSVKVGDCLQFRKVPSAYGYSDSVVEAVEDSGEDGDDELEEDEEDPIVTSVDGSEIGREDEVGEGEGEAGIEVNEDVVMTSGQSGEDDSEGEANAKETFVWLVPVSENGHERKVDEHAIGDEDEAGRKADVWTTSSGESDRDGNADENASENVPKVGEDADVGTVAKSEIDRGHEAESNNEIAEIPDVVDDDDNENEISESTLFLVRGITVYEGVIVNLDLIKLEFTDLSDKPTHSYCIFGEDIVHSGTHSTTCACESSTDMIKLEDTYSLAAYTIHVNPTGDEIRSLHVSDGGSHICTDCNNGFIDTLADLAELVDSSIYASPALMNHQIVCPVCIGLPLLMEQQALRATLDHTSYVDLSAVVDWSGRLASRRTQLGYPFHQFDEREWGYLFDDMPPSDHSDESDFEQLSAEMMDPNTDVPMQPASPAAIAALPRKKFAEVENPGRAGESCLICQEEFEEGSGVVEMPCGHVFHDGECVEQWLGTVSHRCPSCRAELPVAEAEAGEGGEVGEGEGEEHEDDEDDDDEEDEDDDEEDDENDHEDEEDGGEGDEVQVEAEQVEEVTYSEW